MFYEHNMYSDDPEKSMSLSSALRPRAQGNQMTGAWSLEQGMAELEPLKDTAVEH